MKHKYFTLKVSHICSQSISSYILRSCPKSTAITDLVLHTPNGWRLYITPTLSAKNTHTHQSKRAASNVPQLAKIEQIPQITLVIVFWCKKTGRFVFSEAAINQSGGGEGAPGCVQATVYSIFIQKEFYVNLSIRVRRDISGKSEHIRHIKQSRKKDISIPPGSELSDSESWRGRWKRQGLVYSSGSIQVSHFILINFPQDVF